MIPRTAEGSRFDPSTASNHHATDPVSPLGFRGQAFVCEGQRAAFSLAASASGGVKAFKTTPLMTVEEGIEAMTKAGSCGYESPS